MAAFFIDARFFLLWSKSKAMSYRRVQGIDIKFRAHPSFPASFLSWV